VADDVKVYEAGPTASVTYYAHGDSARAVAEALLEKSEEQDPDPTGLILEVMYYDNEGVMFEGSLTVTR
jgi:hypothetical protein